MQSKQMCTSPENEANQKNHAIFFVVWRKHRFYFFTAFTAELMYLKVVK